MAEAPLCHVTLGVGAARWTPPCKSRIFRHQIILCTFLAVDSRVFQGKGDACDKLFVYCSLKLFKLHQRQIVLRNVLQAACTPAAAHRQLGAEEAGASVCSCACCATGGAATEVALRQHGQSRQELRGAPVLDSPTVLLAPSRRPAVSLALSLAAASSLESAGWSSNKSSVQHCCLEGSKRG